MPERIRRGGEQVVAEDGVLLASPTTTFLAIRSAFPARDPRLLARKTPEFIPVLRSSLDDGRDVLGATGVDVPLDSFSDFLASGAFDALKRWARARFEELQQLDATSKEGR